MTGGGAASELSVLQTPGGGDSRPKLSAGLVVWLCFLWGETRVIILGSAFSKKLFYLPSPEEIRLGQATKQSQQQSSDYLCNPTHTLPEMAH